LDEQISRFMEQYQSEIAMQHLNRKIVNAFIDSLENSFTVGSAYFKEYFYYRKALISLIAGRMTPEKAGAEYFAGRPVLLDNPAYMELFEKVFDNFFAFYNLYRKDVSVYTLIKESGYTELCQLIATEPFIRDEKLAELVSIKGMLDAWYEKQVEAQSFIGFMEWKVKNSPYPEIASTANRIIRKTTRLMAGYPAPDFNLCNPDSNLVSLSSLKGKYIYLNFCTSQSFACQQDFGMLEQLKKKFGRQLEIVTISTDRNFREFAEKMYSQGFDWTLLHYAGQPEILKEYGVKVFPTYFLIDPYGSLVISPALSPGENFENQFRGVLNKRN
jgi:peroxiredoxin